METVVYGHYKSVAEIPDLVEMQTRSYRDFLQPESAPNRRKVEGLEALLREVFPIYSYDKSLCLEYVSYELGRPRYTVEECRKLRLTYGYPFKIRVRLVKPEPVEEEIYLGEIPIMIGGGEFIINGSERVTVSQLHRSPGVDFSVELSAGDKKLHSCWIIPERGSWIEINVTKKDAIAVRIDQSGKFSCSTLLRAMDIKFSTDAAVLREFYNVEKVVRKKSDPEAKFAKALVSGYAVGDIVDAASGEPFVRSGEEITEEAARAISQSELKEVEVLRDPEDLLILNTLREDTTNSHEEALLKIYQRLRPGNPPQIEKARDLFKEKFFDETRYRLGRVGRFRLNRKFSTEIPESKQTLSAGDFVQAIRYILELRAGRGELDDIDHLGNRRVRTIQELAGDEFRKGFLKLRRTAQERMNLENVDTVTPRNLINSKTFSSAIEYFFGRGELSQVVDQTNPLSQLAHERRLSALGPGGLNRKRAGFEVRDVHISHFGRLCPIETPEGANIGLISSLAIYSSLDEYGFLTTPYLIVKNGKLTDEVVRLRADEENNAVLAPADSEIDKSGKLIGDEHGRVVARVKGDPTLIDTKEVQYLDVSPKQIVGVSASLIPFLEHDDANRALMGSNMQRQAVPLLTSEPPIVQTGMEEVVAHNSSMLVKARKGGTVSYVDATRIVIGDDVYKLRKFEGLNERTCQNQVPIVKPGQKVKTNEVLADGAATKLGVLALGKNLTVAFMPWDGYNYEDAILLSENLVKEDVYTSIHIDEFDIEIRETKLGREEFTRDIPNVSERALRYLDETGIVRVGTRVKPGDILVGKVAPKSKSELTPEEKLLHAIFGRAGEDVKNASLEVPTGVEGIVIAAEKFSRKVNLTENERTRNLEEIKSAEVEFLKLYRSSTRRMLEEAKELAGKALVGLDGKKVQVTDEMLILDLRGIRDRVRVIAEEQDEKVRAELVARLQESSDRIEEAETEKNKLVNRLSRGDELPTGVLEMVKVYVSTKRRISVGDKMAGRHGNKGVISKILPQEDMPFLADGTPVDIVLNPLGVPSRMNVGQILETHLGWAAKKLGFRAISPVFDGASEQDIEAALIKAGFATDGKSILYDGRTGEAFTQRVTVGTLYMLKLHHLVDDKVHARATGPYSLITQQPLGGKARFGGQRFGEMEVWALEAYGAANVLQELLTVKSDDVDGRTKIYEAMVKNENILEPGTPVSFGVLCNEIKGLGLNIELHKRGTAESAMPG
ncbi:DNA-directed RNA polymerase subunit beta [Planctomycetota bacterium]|jgi:DNA-directed RNA polymerase subunit beta|nr:DNA-directed RNA polymerase subunit beta [Planctomycetota bacterium]GDY00987.1 DNA-directed RNA polymerase subunit beta [Planctomycetota bacterium]